jgi:hypothetical protein
MSHDEKDLNEDLELNEDVTEDVNGGASPMVGNIVASSGVASSAQSAMTRKSPTPPPD